MIRVAVLGTPIPQGSKRAFVVGGRAVVTDVKGPELKAWRSKIAAAVREAGERLDGPVAVRLVFYLERPKTVKRLLPSTPPDTDKLCRAVFDALTESGCLEDDSRITTVFASKRYGDFPGVHITVQPDIPNPNGAEE